MTLPRPGFMIVLGVEPEIAFFNAGPFQIIPQLQLMAAQKFNGFRILGTKSDLNHVRAIADGYVDRFCN